MKRDWTRWQETVDKIAIMAGENMDSSCHPKKDKISQDMWETNTTETNDTKNKDGTRQSSSETHVKRNLEKTKILETGICSRQFEQGFQGRLGPPFQ